MFLCGAKADDADRALVRSFGERHHEQARADRSDGNEAHFAIIETIVLALQCRVPIEIDRRPQRYPMLAEIGRILRGIEFDIHPISVHPLKLWRKRVLRGPGLEA